MPMYVNYNGSALMAQRSFDTNQQGLSDSFEKLSSGFRINRASDDAAGLQISERLRTQIRGMNKARDNVQDALNVMGVLEGGLTQITENLQRMRELTVQAGNDTLASTQRTAIDAEMDQLRDDITRIANATSFNGLSLLNGSVTNFYIQVGPNNSATNDIINLATTAATNPLATISATSLGIQALDVMTNAGALATIALLDTALNTLNDRRATIGALSNRLQGSVNFLDLTIEKVSDSESRIRNVDVARETTELSRNQILQQASLSVLQQANQLTAGAAQLLRPGQ
ncbi:MAG: flagellin [Vampirovibrionales bacterium]